MDNSRSAHASASQSLPTAAGELGASIVLTVRRTEGDSRRPMMAQRRDGTLLLAYTRMHGGGDFAAADIAARTSSDGGWTWSEEDVTLAPNEGGVNVMSTAMLRMADGSLSMSYLVKHGRDDCRPVIRFSHDEGKQWSEPTWILGEQDKGYYAVNPGPGRLIRLKSGRLLMPLPWADLARVDESVSKVFTAWSDDDGHSWQRNNQPIIGLDNDGELLPLQEPGIVELRDGRVLMFIRTDRGTQHYAWSEDGGENWSRPIPSAIRSPLSPAAIRRIPRTGDLLLAWNDNYVPNAKRKGERKPLNVAISNDEGETWQRSQVLYDQFAAYPTIYFLDNDVLVFCHCGPGEGQGLNAFFQLLRFPVDRLYGSA